MPSSNIFENGFISYNFRESVTMTKKSDPLGLELLIWCMYWVLDGKNNGISELFCIEYTEEDRVNIPSIMP